MKNASVWLFCAMVLTIPFSACGGDTGGLFTVTPKDGGGGMGGAASSSSSATRSATSSADTVSSVVSASASASSSASGSSVSSSATSSSSGAPTCNAAQTCAETIGGPALAVPSAGAGTMCLGKERNDYIVFAECMCFTPPIGMCYTQCIDNFCMGKQGSAACLACAADVAGCEISFAGCLN